MFILFAAKVTYYCLTAKRKDEKIVTKQELKRYEAENVNDIWACDTTYSFKVMDNGLKKRIFIIAIIDDASRAIVGINCFFEDNYVNFMSVLKSAVKKTAYLWPLLPMRVQCST